MLDRHDRAVRAAREGVRQALNLAARIVGEMAADHEEAGKEAEAEVLHEAVEPIRTLPKDVP